MKYCLIVIILTLICHSVAFAEEAKRDPLSAEELFQQGLDLFEGQKTAKDIPAALQAWKDAADSNHVVAMYNLGVVYANGLDVTPDPALALHWYTRAAELGNSDAMFNLGVLYGDRELAEMDSLKAIHWYERAGEAGDMRAQHNLGVMYEYGDLVAVDSLKAASWYLKAAQQGMGEAQLKIGRWYCQEGVFERNPMLAYVWLWLGSVNCRNQSGWIYEDDLQACEELLDDWQIEQARAVIEAVMECYERNRR